MATAGESPGQAGRDEEENASDESFQYTCTPCSQTDKMREAEEYCMDCQDYYCSTCREYHGKFGATRGHQVIDKTQFANLLGAQQGSAPMLPTERCDEHHGKLIDTWCAQHNEVCCATCVILHHRTCDNVQYIPKMAKGAICSFELEDTKKGVKKIKAKLTDIKDEQKRECDRMVHEREKSASNIEQVIEGLIEQLKGLKRTAQIELNRRHQAAKENAEANIECLDAKIQDMEARIKLLEDGQGGNEAQEFIDVKMAQHLEAQGELIIRQHRTATVCKNIEFVIKEDVLEMLSSKTSICDFIDNSEFEISLKEKFSVAAQDDKKKSDLTGICKMEKGNYLITDWTNKKLKRTDKNFKLFDQLIVPGLPFAVCTTVAGEAAVTLTYEQKVQFISTAAKLTLGRSFDVGKKCRGLAYSAGEMYVSCGGDTEEGEAQVRVYDLSGNFNRILRDRSDQKIFYKPRHIAVSEDSTKIHIADTDHGALTMDKNGNLLAIIKDQEFKNPWGICVGEGRQLFYCRRYTNKVGYGDWQGRSHVLRCEKDDIKKPQALVFDKNTSTLVVIEEKSDFIKVFRIITVRT